jgi:hypothetical protein
VAKLEKEWMDSDSRKGGKVSRAVLESVAGYLIYVSRPYPSFKPYLIGLYNTMNGWRPDREPDGWKRETLQLDVGDEKPLGPNIPDMVRPVHHFLNNIVGLEALPKSRTPLERMVRPTRLATVIYRSRDAAKLGFGMSNWTPAAAKVEFKFGVWVEMAREALSNYRELANLVAKIERLRAEEMLLAGSWIFLFKDNLTAELVFTRGSGKSPEIFSLVLRLHKLQMEGNIFVQVVWIAGMRMIAWGGNGLS